MPTLKPDLIANEWQPIPMARVRSLVLQSAVGTVQIRAGNLSPMTLERGGRLEKDLEFPEIKADATGRAVLVVNEDYRPSGAERVIAEFDAGAAAAFRQIEINASARLALVSVFKQALQEPDIRQDLTDIIAAGVAAGNAP